MTISTKPEDIDSPETILHYMDSYPASGQNRAAAKLIRELLTNIPAASWQPSDNSVQLNVGQVAPQATVEVMQSIIKDALSGFSCMQIASQYPSDHWSQRATALLATPPTSKADTGEVPFNISEWHDATWIAMRDKALNDSMVKPMNIHTVRAFCDASFAALAKNSGVSDHMENAALFLAENIRALKSATPSTIKAEPTGEKL